MKHILFAASFLLALSIITTPVIADNAPNQNEQSNIPERNGDYPDPQHPGIRVRVFVHEPKSAKTTLPITPICSDNDSTTTVSTTGWKLPAGTITYQLNTSSAPSNISIPTIAANAFTTWDNAQSKVTFIRGADTSVSRNIYDQKNIIAWGNVSGSNTLGITYVRYNTTTGYVVDVDTILNRKVKWSWTNPLTSTCSTSTSTYDTQDILTHELGHWMGLDDEYDTTYSNATMFGYASMGEIKKDTLTSGDSSGILSIYP